ncbi:hypothetical protein [Streptomyces sp. NPDC007007]|uniref:hypothetical protein n=1 Tax=Streptomyces sp. NPDC007007 TaxID=3364770 RepID=UPI0036D037FB
MPESWWAGLNLSLDALAAQTTPHIATPDTESITQELVDTTIGPVFPDVSHLLIDEWTSAH